MRVLHVCQPTDGGAPVVVRELARAGVRAGDDVVVAGPAGGYLGGWVADAGATWVEVPMTRSASAHDLTAVAALRPLLAAADVVHLHSSKAGAVGRLAALTLGRRRPRVVFTPHGWSFYVGGRAAGLYRRLERVLARVTDVVTVVSQAELVDGQAVLGPGPHGRPVRFEVVENGVDTRRFTPEGPTADRTAAPLVVQVGRLSEQKGQDRSLRALAGLRRTDARLRLVGSGPSRTELEALAVGLGVADRLEWVGSTDPRPHLRAADVVIMPSRWEGMSLVLLEAMATGCAVVSTACGGSDALAGVGRLVPVDPDAATVAGLVTALDELLDDPSVRSGLGADARRRAVERYSLDRTVATYRRLWSETAS